MGFFLLFINTNISVSSKFSLFHTTIINVVFWTVSLVPAVFTVLEVQDRKIATEAEHDSSSEETPAGVDVAQKDNRSEKV